MLFLQAKAEQQPSAIPAAAYTFSYATLIVYVILVPTVLLNTHRFEHWASNASIHACILGAIKPHKACSCALLELEATQSLRSLGSSQLLKQLRLDGAQIVFARRAQNLIHHGQVRELLRLRFVFDAGAKVCVKSLFQPEFTHTWIN